MTSPGWFKKVFLLNALLWSTLVFFVFDSSSIRLVREEATLESDTINRFEIEITAPRILFGMVIDDIQVIEDEVKRDQRFVDLLENHHVEEKILRQISLVQKEVFDFRKVGAHKKYTLLVRNDSLRSARALIYEPNSIDYYIFYLEDSLVVEACQREITVVEKSVSGTVESSLSETIEAIGISHELTNKFVDIFAWQVDFQRLQKGDQFKLIYQENQVENKTIGIRLIEAIYFEHLGNSYYALPFNQGNGLDYYDEQGHSLRKALLKYPIEFTRISSRYNPHRFHPVAKVFRAHRGTDFAAPTGTPIRSVGDGVVEEAQYRSANGNYVKIRHNNTYSTQYLHMSKIAAGIRPGTRVRQGQNIGFVGSTGLANGPHLCYRFWKNGVQVDALKVQLPPAQPVKEENLISFEQVRADIIMKLDLIPLPFAPPEIASVLK